MIAVGLFVLALGGLAEDRSVDMNDRPVAKVLGLLKDMQTQLMDEKKSDEAQYEKMACWCENNRGKKSTATEVAAGRIENLEHSIKALTAKASGLDSSIKELNSELASNTEALATATAMRAKEAAAFHADESDLLVSMESLKAAIVMLKKHQGSAFLQMPKSFAQVQSSIKKIVNDNDDLINQILSPSARSALGEFMQAPQAYTSNSGEIFGVMEQMAENFESNLAGARKDEAIAKSAFDELKAAKSEEIATGTSQVKDKTTVLSRTQEELQEAKEDHRDTSGALSADQAFLLDLEKRCAEADASWMTRSKTRSLEISAVSEAITILSNDDAHDTFQRSLGFLQLHASQSDRRAAASKILLAQAAKSTSHAVQLQSLAASAKLDAFTKVQKAMDDMISALKQQQADEVVHKDFCKDELQKNDGEAFKTDNEIKDLSMDIEEYGSTIDTLANDIAALQAEIQDSQTALQQANENRIAQNKEFQTVVADQRATQVILKKALDRLNKFYGFVQTGVQPGASQAPEPMAEYKANAGAGGVLTMIGNVLTDAENLEKDATASEQASQDAYIAFAQETFASVAASAQAATNKQAEKAGAEKSKVGATADRTDALTRAEGLNKYKGELHKSCDFVVDNFDARQNARREELDSLQSAKAALKTA